MVPCRRAILLPFLFFLVAAASPGVVAPQEDTAGSSHHPPLLDCASAPPTPPADHDTAFRANLASVLVSLPSAAAVAPKGFATARSGSGGTGRGDRAFARGLCFGANATSSPAAGRACLSAAASDATTGRCGASRRAGVWCAGCFLAYADTDATSPREYAFRGWFYAGPNMTKAAATTLADRVCAGDRPAAECDRCFEGAARAASELGWLARIRGQEVLIVGYTCCLPVRISVLPQGPEYTDARRFALEIWLFIMLFVAEMTILGTLCTVSLSITSRPGPC